MYNLSFSGDIAIVNHSKRIGKMKAKLYQTDKSGNEMLCIDEKGLNGEYKLIHPHDQIEKQIYFVLELSQIEIIEG